MLRRASNILKKTTALNTRNLSFIELAKLYKPLANRIEYVNAIITSVVKTPSFCQDEFLQTNNEQSKVRQSHFLITPLLKCFFDGKYASMALSVNNSCPFLAFGGYCYLKSTIT